MLIKGTNDITALYKGTQEIVKRYKGTLVVYEAFQILTATGVPPLTLTKCKNDTLIDYRIEGATTQSGTPTIDNPIEYQSVGDLVTDTQDINYGKYKIPIVVKDTTLPSEYQEVEYIESTGTQYIDTGLKLNQDSRVKIKYQYKDDTTSARVLGDAHSSSNGWVISTATGAIDSNIQTLYGNKWCPLPTESPLVIPSTDIIEYERNGVYQYVNGNLYYTNSSTTFETTNNVTVFGAYSGSALGLTKVRIYSLQIWQDGTTLSRNFVPCYRKSDGVNGLYDIVNDVFYENSGTETFVKGNDVGNGTIYSTTNIYLNEPLRKLVRDSSTQFIDYIDFENNKVIRNTREVVVTGNENWETISSGTPRMFRYKLSSQKIGPETQSSFPDQFCNCAICRTVTVSGSEIGASAYYSSSVSGGGTIFRIRPETNYTSVSTFTNKLKSLYNAGTPLKYIFPIYNATEESITLPDITLDSGTNVITTDTLIKPSEIYVKYKGR